MPVIPLGRRCFGLAAKASDSRILAIVVPPIRYRQVVGAAEGAELAHEQLLPVEHPVFDIWLTACKSNVAEPQQEAGKPEGAAPQQAQ
jgi:hypothetical protein